MVSVPYLLVAERSVLPCIESVILSLEKHGGPAAIYLIVPASQITEFRSTRCGRHEVLSEDTILPDWPLDRIRGLLPTMPDRAGWYLQQFLKMSFGITRGIERYVIWDADTVMLKKPTFVTSDDRVLMNPAREYHRPYFETFERLFGEPPVLSSSVISQYMLMDSGVVRQMCSEIETRHNRPWIEAVLASLPARSPSEFSEYETYANFLERRRPGTVSLTRERWFRYGSDVLAPSRQNDLAHVEQTFARYAYVSFERHRITFMKQSFARLLLLFGMCS